MNKSTSTHTQREEILSGSTEVDIVSSPLSGPPSVGLARKVPSFRKAMLAAIVAVLTIGLLGTSASAQSVESLRERANRISNELNELEERASVLDEQYLTITEELEDIKADIAEKQAAVDAAQSEYSKRKDEAVSYAVEAYVGAGTESVISLGASDPNEAVHQQALLQMLRGDREVLADQILSGKEDLEIQSSELEAARTRLEERQTEQAKIVEEIEAAVGRHEQLLSSANAELQQAIEAERRRREEEAARRAAEEARRQEAARQAAEQQRQAAAAAQRSRVESQRATSNSSSSSSNSSSTASRPAPAPAEPSAPVAAPNGGAAAAIAAARSQLGLPYKWAGTSPATGFDCSGLTQWAWRQAGVSIPRTSGAQRAGTQRISASQLQPGDLVFYGSPVHHVGLYIGGGQMIHSPRTGDVVKIAPIHRGFGNPSGYGRVR